MADGVSITAGSGTVIATDQVTDGTLGTVQVQYVKLMDGTLDGTTKYGGTTAFPVTDTKLPTAAAAADNVANPTVTQIGANNLLYNGTTWDRHYGNWVVSTGDTGAKTASFNGITQTNYNARGAFITLVLGTVSGASPTLTMQVQWTPDGGTTWLAIGAVTTAVTASSQTATIGIYPTNFSVAGATPGALTTGSNQTTFINAPLPRTWRIAYTIGGTTPSFAISRTSVSYIV